MAKKKTSKKIVEDVTTEVIPSEPPKPPKAQEPKSKTKTLSHRKWDKFRKGI
jgi:hypothetical protein